jgi:hypothetical protein
MWMLRTAKSAVFYAMGGAFDGAPNTGAWVFDRIITLSLEP